LNEISAQASVETSTSNCTRIFGSASVTTDESARTSPTARPSSAIRFRDPSGRMSRRIVDEVLPLRGGERDQEPRDCERAASFEVSSEHERHLFSTWGANPAPATGARR
jgi:hypothetical protein